MAAEGLQEIKTLREVGFNDEEVSAWANTEKSTMLQSGFTQPEIDDYFGEKQFDTAPVQTMLDKNFEGFVQKRTKELLQTSQAAPAPNLPQPIPTGGGDETAKPQPKEADSFLEALEAGFQVSVSGLMARQQNPDITTPDTAEWYMRIANQVGMTVGDIPPMLAGGLLASPAGVVGGPTAPLASIAAAGFGMNALPAAMREVLMQSYEKGEVQDFQDFWTRSSAVFLSTVKNGIVGALTAGVGGKVAQVAGASAPLIRTTGKTAAEITTMAVVGRALDGEAPKINDFTDAAIVIFGMHAVTAGTAKLQKIYARTGMKPTDVAQQALEDPILRQELAEKGPGIPKSYEPFIDPAASPDPVQAIKQDPRMGDGELVMPKVPAEISKAFQGKDGAQYTVSVEKSHSAANGRRYDSPIMYEVVARDAEGNQVGYVSFDKIEQPSNPAWHPDALTVSEANRRQGVATAMYDFAKKELKLDVQPEVQPNNRSDEGSAFRKAYGEGKSTKFEDVGPSPLDTNKSALMGFLREETGSAGVPTKTPAPVRSEAESKVLSRVGDSPEKPKFELNWNRAYTAAIDKFNPIAKFAQVVTGGKKLAADADPYTLARLTRGNAGRATQFIENAPFSFKTFENIEGAKPLKEIFKPFADDLDGWRAYSISKRAIGLEKRGVKTGIDVEAAKQVVTDGAPKYESALQEVVKYRGYLLRYMRDAGILTEAQIKNWETVDPDYAAPFYRILEDDAAGGPMAGKGLSVKNPIKAIKGSDLKLIDPVESLVRDTYTFIELAERNRVLRSVVELGEKFDAPPELLQKVEAAVKPIDVTPEEIARFASDIGSDMEVAGQMMTVFRPLRQELTANQIALYREGKRQVYQVPPELAESLKQMDSTSANVLMRVLAGPSKTLKAGTTILPEFVLKNFIRDQLSAFVFSTNGYIPVVDFVHGLGEQFTKGPAYQQWLKGGGANATFVSMDRNYISENVLRLEPVKSVRKRVWNYVGTPIQAAQMFGELVENATRVGEMKRGMKGKAATAENVLQKSLDTRELTLDFSRQGGSTAMQAANQAIAFMNPQMQGLDRAIRAFKENPLGTTIRVAAAVTVPSILFWLANRDDPRYAEIPRWQKDLFWHVMADNWQPATREEAGTQGAFARQNEMGDWEVNHGAIYKIPKPQELGILFGSIPERMMQAVWMKDKKAFSDLEETVFEAALPGMVPNVAIPFIETFNNKSMFTGAPIVPGHLEGTLPEVQYTEYTSATAKKLSQILPPIPFGELKLSSPMVIENWVRAWTGGLGMYALQLSDQALVATGVEPPSSKATAAFADIPIIKAFVTRFPSASAQSIVDFRGRYKESQVYVKSVEVSRGRGDFESMQRIRFAEKNQSKFVTLDGIQDSLNTLKRNIELVNANPEFSPDEKRQLIDGLYFTMINFARHGNQLADEIKGIFEGKGENNGR